MIVRENCVVDRNFDSHQLKVPLPRDSERIREVLERTHYAKEVFASLATPRLPIAMGIDTGKTSQPPGKILMRLFLHSQSVTAADAEKALMPMSVSEWEQAGLLCRDQDRVFPLVMLTPYQGLIFASDIDSRDQAGVETSVVKGITRRSLWLAALTVRRHARLTLDLGTGNGLHALLAASHSEQVLAVDNNPRALAFARFNAQLNGIANIGFVEGDFLLPFEAEKFDLILADTPCLIGPEYPCVYREERLSGDQLLQRLMQAVPRYLNQGGFAQIIGDWVECYDQDWQRRLGGWVDLSTCDTWVMYRETQRPAEYAENLLRIDDAYEFDRRFMDWMSYYRRKHIEALVNGVINIHCSDRKPNWYRVGKGPERLLPDAGDDIERGFEMQDYLLRLGDDRALLNTRFRTFPHVRLERHKDAQARGWRAFEARLVRTRGLALSVPLTPDMEELVINCDGSRSLGQLIHELSVQSGRVFEELQRQLTPPFKQLVADGFLIPTESNGKTMNISEAWSEEGTDNHFPGDQSILIADTIEPG